MSAPRQDPEAVVEAVGVRVERGFERLMGGLSADDVFGSVTHADRVVVTAATIERAGGFGFGAGAGTDPDEAGGGGGGGGGGGTAAARPVAVVEVTPDGAVVRPVLDYTRIGITVALAALAVWRTLRAG